MRAITYKNTRTTIPHWDDRLHINQGRGVAYETDTHFVHFYCRDAGLFVLSPGLTVTEQKTGALEDWAAATFGARDVQNIQNPVGETSEGAWRPGLTMATHLQQGLGNDAAQKHSDLVALRLLLSALESIFEFFEPIGAGLSSYGHKTRELLISACTELENQWKRHLNAAGVPAIGRDFTTADYVKLYSALSLKEYQMTARAYGTHPPIIPFSNWDDAAPTRSLSWYDAYNKTKHDRAGHFDKASVENCISAVVANAVLFCARNGPNALVDEVGGSQTLFQQLFEVELCQFDPTTYYVSKIEMGSDQMPDLICYDSFGALQCQPWSVQRLIL